MSKIKQLSNKNRINYTDFLLALSLGIILIYFFTRNFMASYGITVINDEFGYWGIAASWTNKDWDSLLASTPYYSYGYSILLVVLYNLLGSQDSVQLIYQCALGVNIFFLIGSFVIAYLCGKFLFKEFSTKQVMIISFVITLYSNNVVQAQIAWPETMLYFLYWFLIFCIIRLLETLKIRWMIGFGIVNLCIYFVHQRTVGIVLSSIIVLILAKLLKKISWKQLVLFAIILGIGLWGGSQLKNSVIEELFTNKELAAMNDYSGQTNKIKTILTTLSGFSSFLKSLLGKLFYLGAATFLLGFIAIEKICLYLIQELNKLRKKLGELDDQFVVEFYILLSFTAMLAISAIAMFDSKGRYDILLYGRYMELAIGPLLLIGSATLVRGKVNLENLIINSVLLIIISFPVNIELISLKSNEAFFNSICSTALTYFFNIAQVDNISFWIAIYVVFVITAVCLFVRINGGKNNSSLCALLIIVCCWLNFADSVNIEQIQNNINNGVGRAAENIKKLEAEYDIYTVSDSQDTGFSKYLQYYLPDYTIEEVDLKEISVYEDESLFVAKSNAKLAAQIFSNYHILDKYNNFIIFTKDISVSQDWKEHNRISRS